MHPDHTSTMTNLQTDSARPWTRAELWVIGALFAYALARGVFLAFNLDPAIPPDEITHVSRIEVFERTWGIPGPQIDLARVGFIPGEPYLFYWIAARLMPLNVFPISDLVFARLLMVALHMGTLVYAVRWMRLFSGDPLARILFTVMITNTLMFTLMSATVSYDGLAVFCSAASVFHLTSFLRRRELPSLLWLGFFVLFGMAAKVTFLPLAFILIVCVAMANWRRVFQFKLQRSEAPLPWTVWPLATATLVLLVLNVALYGANLLRFHALIPVFTDVYEENLIMESPIWARDRIVDRYLSGDLDFKEAMAQAETITMDSASRDTMKLLKFAENKRRQQVEFSPVPRFFYPFSWLYIIAGRIFGILAHENLIKERWALFPYFLVFFLASGRFLERWRLWRQEPYEPFMALIVAFYVVVLMQLVNYPSYIQSQEIIVAIQGRYLFLILVPLLGLAAHYYLVGWPKAVRYVLFAAAAVVFVWGDFPYFLTHADVPKFFGNP